jgi:hypothetical protein
MTETQEVTLRALYMWPGTTRAGLAQLLKIGRWAAGKRAQGLIEAGYAQPRRPKRRPARGRTVPEIVPTLPPIIVVAGERCRLVAVEPPRREP